MKSAQIKKNRIVIKDAPKPNLKKFGFGAIIKTSGCGLCGSDIVKFRQNFIKEGTVLGHEIVGEIVEINSKTAFKIGDKIVSSHHIPCFKCNYCKNKNYSMCKHFKETNIIPGGFSEYIYLSEEHLQNVAVKILKKMTEIEASFYEPLGCCIRAIKRGGGKYKGKKVLVVGLGSIGLLMGQALKAYGANVFGCDIIQERIDFAKKFKIKAVHSSKTQKLDSDIVFMTAGADATIDLALKAVRDGGKIVVFASTPKNFGYANNEIYYRELTVLGSYSPSPKDLKEAMKLLSSAKVKVKNISTVYDFCDIEKAFRDTIENKVMKAYIKVG
ncbi:MAG TPA: alcohol dehydrogenase catalytic domain-containing protein [Candidatus Gastranaerophilaceae bacterium]|nr:alcohol dehydrogenase catalytic domain-containing protein [Candidatus Gastranaerophilaceae bacterium]HPT41238.1 alcohol dehydrogenase catalytic domain-containing protein [Candidatus Gastranaerophilaceae bacterium]